MSPLAEVGGLAILLLVALVLLMALLTAMLVRGARRPPRHTFGYALARRMAPEPDDLGYATESWSLDRPDGAVLPVWEVRHGREGAPRRAVVFCHGWGHGRVDSLDRIAQDRDLWESVGDRFVMYDLRGHGDAEGMSRLGVDEEDDLADLVERLGDDPVVVVGHSMGAAIGLRASAGERLRDRVQGVVAYSAYDGFHGSLARRLKKNGLPARPLTDLALSWLRLRGLRHEPLSATLDAIACPVLFVQGADDRVAPLDEVERLAERLPQARLEVFHGAAHGDAHRVDPDRHRRVVEEWMNGL